MTLSKEELREWDRLTRLIRADIQAALRRVKAREARDASRHPKGRALWEPGALLRKAQMILPPPNAAGVLRALDQTLLELKAAVAQEVIPHESVDRSGKQLLKAMVLETLGGHPLRAWLESASHPTKALEAYADVFECTPDLRALMDVTRTSRPQDTLAVRRVLNEVASTLHRFFSEVALL